MRFLIDKAVIVALCTAVQLYSAFGDLNSIIAILVAVTVSSLLQSLNFSSVKYVLEIGYIILCILFMPACFSLPLVFYDILCSRHKLSLFCLIFPAISLVAAENYILLLIIIIISAMSYWLNYKTEKMYNLSETLIRTRDTDAELNLLLNKQNKTLIENQNNKIYLATLEERNRISREIHDNVGHLLSRSLLQVGALIAITDEKELPVHKMQLESIKETLDNAMDSTRNSIHNMHNDSIDLMNSINEILNSMKDRYEIVSDLDFSTAIPSNVKLCFISTVKEAVSNIVKHSNATKIIVMIREHPAFYQLSVSDNGTTSKNDTTDGMGLSNMRERVDALGGIFRIEKGNGFKIFISIQKEK